jgi:hypothetical protein
VSSGALDYALERVFFPVTRAHRSTRRATALEITTRYSFA